ALRISDFDSDASPVRLIDNDAGVGIEPLVALRRMGEQLLVDGIPALDGEYRNTLEAQLFVKTDCMLVVVHHGQVQKRRTAGLKVLGEPPYQQFADSGMRAARIDRKTPEGRAVLGIVEGAPMVDTGDGADDVSRGFVLRHQIDNRPAVPIAPEEVGPDRDHTAALVDGVDGIRIGFGSEPADEEATRLAPSGTISGKIEPIGVGGIQKQLLRREREQYMRVADIEGDVALGRPLLAQRLHYLGVAGTGLGGKPTPSP